MKIRQVTKLSKEDISGRDFSFEISSEVAKPYEPLALGAEIVTTPVVVVKKDFGFDELSLRISKSRTVCSSWLQRMERCTDMFMQQRLGTTW